MPAVRLRAAAVLLAAASAALPTGAVGLGPLAHEGNTLTDRKGFYLTLINPYPRPEKFRLYGLGWDHEAAATRVRVPVAETVLGASSKRKVLVIATDLQPGEQYRFRLCAERATPEEGMIHARVCSKLVARRVG